ADRILALPGRRPRDRVVAEGFDGHLPHVRRVRTVLHRVQPGDQATAVRQAGRLFVRSLSVRVSGAAASGDALSELADADHALPDRAADHVRAGGAELALRRETVLEAQAEERDEADDVD